MRVDICMATANQLSGTQWSRVFGAWLIALPATLSALFFSEAVGLVPLRVVLVLTCFMFPLAFVLRSACQLLTGVCSLMRFRRSLSTGLRRFTVNFLFEGCFSNAAVV